MKYIALLSILLATTPAKAELLDFGNSDPGGYSVWHEDHWDWMGIHVVSPVSVPEPSNPIVLLTAAGAVLLMRRTRK